MSDELSESVIVDLFITEPEDIEIIKEIDKMLDAIHLISVEPSRLCAGCFDVKVMVESLSQLYLLGRFVGVDRKRLYNKDY